MENYITYNPNSKQYKYGILLSIIVISGVFFAISFGPIIIDSLLKITLTKIVSIPLLPFKIKIINTFFEAIIALCNILLALYVFLDLYWIHPIAKVNDNSTTSESFKQLLRGWKRLWFFWILLYGCLFIRWSNLSDSLLLHFSADFFDMINGFWFFYLFFVLDDYSVNTETNKKRASGFNKKLVITLFVGLAAFIISTFVYVQSHNEIAFNFLPTFEIDENNSFFASNLIAAYAAVGMAFFFGRLDSHYLNISRIILAPLYLYAVIQLFWSADIFSKEKSANRIVIFLMALVLKFVIFYLVSKGIREKFLFDYMKVAEKEIEKKRKLEFAINEVKENETILTIYFELNSNLGTILKKLGAINSIYNKFSQLNATITEYPLKVILFESGSLKTWLIGESKIISEIIETFKEVKSFYYRTYTKEGKRKQRITETKEYTDLIVSTVKKFEEIGDVKGITNENKKDIKRIVSLIINDALVFVEGEKDIKIDEIKLPNGSRVDAITLEHDQNYLLESNAERENSIN